MLDLSHRKLFFNTLYNLAGKILPLLVGLISIPIFIHQIGVERFGILTIVWALIGYFGVFDLGLGRATTKFVAEYLALDKLDELPALVWTSLILLFGLGLIAGALVYLATPVLVDRFFKISPGLVGEASQSFSLLAVTIPFVFTTACLQGVLEAQQRFALINAVRVPASLANYLAPLPILFFTHHLAPVVAMTVALRLLVWLAFFLLGRRALPDMHRLRLPNLRYVRQLLSFGGWLTVSGIVSPIMVYLDRFLIGALLSMEVVAYYVTPYELVGKLFIIPASLMPVLFPAFSAFAADQHDKLASLHRRAVKYVFLALAPVIICVIILAQPFLHLWLGPTFARISTPIMQLLAVGVLINALAQVPYGAVQAVGRPDLTAKLHLLELPLYLGLLWGLTVAWGLIGVAVAWVLRVTFDGAMLFWWANRLIPATPRLGPYNKPALGLGLAILTLGVLASTMISSLSAKIIMLPVLLIILAVWAWRYLLDDYDKAQVHSAKDKLWTLRCSS
jgi:O-antigen/teichoic acid export membrane protein